MNCLISNCTGKLKINNHSYLNYRAQPRGGSWSSLRFAAAPRHRYGIIIRMYLIDNQHHNLPHFHAKYAEFEASIRIEDGEVLAGELPRKQLRLVQAWIELHRDELQADWELAVAGENPYKITPL